MTIILPLKAFKVYSRSSCLLCGAKLLQTAMQKRLLTTLQKCLVCTAQHVAFLPLASF